MYSIRDVESGGTLGYNPLKILTLHVLSMLTNIVTCASSRKLLLATAQRVRGTSHYKSHVGLITETVYIHIYVTNYCGTFSFGLASVVAELMQTDSACNILQISVCADSPSTKLFDNGRIFTRVSPWGIKRCRILRRKCSAVGFYHLMTLGNGTVVTQYSPLRRSILDFGVALELIR